MPEKPTLSSTLQSAQIPGRRPLSSRFAEAEHARNIRATLVRILSYFSRERLLLTVLALVVVAGALAGVYAPTRQSQAIDLISDGSGNSLLPCVLAMLGAYLLYCLCSLIQTLLCAHLGQRIVSRIREEFFSKLVQLPIRYLDTHSHGDVMSRVTNDIENISSSVSTALPSLFSGILTIIGTASVMLWYCWQLALLSFATILLTVLATRLISRKVRKYSRIRQSLLGSLNGTVEEMISGYRTVVAYNQQDEALSSFQETSDRLTEAGIHADIFSGVMGPIMNCISNIGFVIIAAFGGYFAWRGIISIGVISAFIVYARQFSRPINEIAQVYGQIQTAIAGAERVFTVLDEPAEDQSGTALRHSETASIEFRNLNFSYIPGHPVIHDFSLTVPSGKKVALVGSTGSGKTTIVNLLMRYYDPDSGVIRINGQDLSCVSRPSLRSRISIVLQDTVLFSDTIRNNLLFARENASDADLEHAALISCSLSMIQHLPDGFNTVLTGSGSELSQGQRQLLAIARAFIADPDILILDEATSSVDTRTEKSIQDAMQRVMKDRTSIVIAHRLSTIRDADMIIVMDQGRIVESGSHHELLLKRGRYYELYRAQYAGFET